MEKHERRCYRNPNRMCDFCSNTGVGFMQEDYGMGVVEVEVECSYCAKYNDWNKENPI